MVKPTDRQVAIHSLALLAGHRVLWFELRSVPGRGGCAIISLVHDHHLDQPVAIKEYLAVLCAARGGDATVLPLADGLAEDYRWGHARLIEEGRILARFGHPAVVRMHSVFEATGTAYLVMRYERGESRDARLRRALDMPETELRPIVDDVMSALQHQHDGGISHRDIKPGNLYVCAARQALLLDLVATRQASDGQTLTVTSLISPGYAPFEQYHSDSSAQGLRADIYALGATAYRAITGYPPPPAIERGHRLIEGHAAALPRLTNAGLSGSPWNLLAALDRALAFHARERPRSIATWRAMFTAAQPATVRRTQPAATTPARPPSHTEQTREARDVRTEPLAAPKAVTLRDPLPGVTARLAATLADRRQRPRHAGALGLLLGGVAGFAALTGLRQDPGTAAPALTGGESVAAVRALKVPAPAGAAPTIPDLLRAAARDLAAIRLTTPARDNALAEYRQVSARDPANAEARGGIDRVVGRDLDLAAAAAARADFAAARDFLATANAVNPANRGITEAESALLRQMPLLASGRCG